MNAPDINTIRQHPAYRAIADIADLLTELSEAKRNLAQLEAKARKQIPVCLAAYFKEAGDAAEDRINLGNGQELAIAEEWWDHSNPLGAVRLYEATRTLEEITVDAIAITVDTETPQA
ncbi:hypothetical protein NH8B_0583 [Pseudogulbenkiania sp. NH8B]|uniref:hypothetical protein n=1 Tax=Pseudogulbenkiania sp. (strain NH8B) TaxID=748280 RepID=UPI0002279587|nr:hypothetical protein [Pseudogulbenkiania sp. NH8B]BAK75418.1 hypothetical protein NH8B_0583 [Pseudogulbenkiania sp. NH8B]